MTGVYENHEGGMTIMRVGMTTIRVCVLVCVYVCVCACTKVM